MLNKRKCIAIIPARGGSKRLPHKNILNFHGKPMIAWTIESALNAKIFDRILVSTDCEKIANVAQNYNLDVPFLRSEFADDLSPVSLATISAIQQTSEILKEEYEVVIQLMPNCPLRNAEDINKAYENFLNLNAPAQISCFNYGWMNPWWAVELKDNLQPHPLFPENLKKRSQDLPKLYCPTGSIWIANTNQLLQERTFYVKNHIFYPLNWKSAMDIDDAEDLELAKATYCVMNEDKAKIASLDNPHYSHSNVVSINLE